MGSQTTTKRVPRGPAFKLVLLAALLSPTACSWSAWQNTSAPRDLLTDLADDGSLARGLSHPEPRVRRLAARALGRLPAGNSVAVVLSAANTESDPETLVEICFALGQWQATESGHFLRRMASHQRPEIRATAVLALGKLADDSRTDLLVAALEDTAVEVRGAAALGLARLDGRRYDHERSLTEEQMTQRDAALARAALQDPDPGVRWRATYALSNIRSRPGLSTILGRCARDESSAVSRIFALRGLGVLQRDSLSTAGLQAPAGGSAVAQARRSLNDRDPRVALEAARIVAQMGPFVDVLKLTEADSSHVRVLALDTLRQRVLGLMEFPIAAAGDGSWRGPLLSACERIARRDASSAVQREARAMLVSLASAFSDETGGELVTGEVDWTGAPISKQPVTRLQAAGDTARNELLLSSDPRDRERVAQLLSTGEIRDRVLLNRLLEDSVPSVVAAALGSLDTTNPDTLHHDRERLEQALTHKDPAIRGTAAQLAGPLIREGTAPPWLVTAVASALEDLEQLPVSEGLEMEEARAELAGALGLPHLDPLPPRDSPRGPLLDRLIEEETLARKDPAPEVLLETSRGALRVVLDRLAAPRHVESFLELADDGFYNGLDIHRVVPNFVVQGLDPRHDGWGVAGRRVPDEFGRASYLTGSLGMPHAGSAHSGGCQIFITHVPTPHLDGAYTHFGKVVEGIEIVNQLEIGDVIKSVRRVPARGS